MIRVVGRVGGGFIEDEVVGVVEGRWMGKMRVCNCSFDLIVVERLV